MAQRRVDETDAEIRRLVVAEVAHQLAPFLEKLDKVLNWQLGFWSNGSKDRPPGFFQMRMKEDDLRNEQDAEEKKQIKDDLKNQTDITSGLLSFIQDQKTLKEYKQKQWKRWKPIVVWAARGLGAALIALMCWIGPKVPKIIRIGFILYQDYLKYHPEASDQIKKADVQSSRAVSSTQTATP